MIGPKQRLNSSAPVQIFHGKGQCIFLLLPRPVYCYILALSDQLYMYIHCRYTQRVDKMMQCKKRLSVVLIVIPCNTMAADKPKNWHSHA